ncbi:sulfur carrier protein ThiS [Limnobacter humi]|uniref:Sulfur carrier protein ThiS n=1 Tax=Limnobacter humi TaxID=1778671 RepID=A0ABT1WF88_9BURK|nr:sulfur carrier protein ThiS [Limnobacter humi]
MSIAVNGQTQEIPEGSSISSLLERLELQGKRIAVEMNGDIVPKSQHAQTLLQAGAQLEIVVAVGGG